MILSPRYSQMNFNKEYMPGYTGHVPTKVDQFGMTAGDVNRAILDAFNPPHSENTARLNHPKQSPTVTLYQATSLQRMTHKNRPLKNIFGNCSKYATNWIAGPTYQMCQ